MAAPFQGRIGKVRYSLDGVTYADILGIQDATIDLQGGTIDTTDHDSGIFHEFIADRLQATMELSCNYEEGDASQDALLSAYINQTVVYFTYRPKGSTSGNQEYKAQGLLTKGTIADPNNGQATVAFSVQLTGQITKSVQP